MKRVVGQCGSLAKQCATDEDQRAARLACYRAGEQGRVDPVPLMVKARSQFQDRPRWNENGYLADVRAGQVSTAIEQPSFMQALLRGDE